MSSRRQARPECAPLIQLPDTFPIILPLIPRKSARCLRAFHLFCRGGDKRIGFIPAGVLLKYQSFLLKNQSISLQIPFISFMRTKGREGISLGVVREAALIGQSVSPYTYIIRLLLIYWRFPHLIYNSMEVLNICILDISACPIFFFEFQNIQSCGALSSMAHYYESISSDVDQRLWVQGLANMTLPIPSL